MNPLERLLFGMNLRIRKFQTTKDLIFIRL